MINPTGPYLLHIIGTILPKVLTAPREARAKVRARTRARARTSLRHPQDGLQTGRQQHQREWSFAIPIISGITAKVTVAGHTTAQSQRMDGSATSLQSRTILQSALRPDRQPSLVLTVRWLGLSQQGRKPQSVCFLHQLLLIQGCLFLREQPLKDLAS